ncbi:MarR family transcriptional regulator [Aeromicrobium sp. UC242_57]|uniref:MarR family transcriptional regulator n=1 Tax=Aeromicrobium sp. UC242_57 TaxID=3374624 RepID=UPI0037BD5048
MTPSEPEEFLAKQPAAFDHAFTVLEAVALRGPGTTARELTEMLPFSRATVFRIVKHLVAHEYLVRTVDLRGFALGARVLALSAPPTLAEDEVRKGSRI